MRSIKSEIYLFVKKLIMGGTHIDTYELNGVSKTRTQVFLPLTYTDTDGNVITCQNYMFYNSNLNEQYFASVLFSFKELTPDVHNLKVSDTNGVATIKERIRFSLFVPYFKLSADMLENDYLDHLDFCEAIHFAVSGKNFLGISTITKVGETFDDDSRVIMGKEFVFETEATTYGETTDINAGEELGTSIDIEVSAEIANIIT